ncbi:DUF3624 family protein [Fibrobacterota bacterium]
MTCKGCPESILSLFSSKLGTCRSCMWSALVLATLCWLGFVILRSIHPDLVLLAATFVFAMIFSFLYLLHITAYFWRRISGKNSSDPKAE